MEGLQNRLNTNNEEIVEKEYSLRKLQKNKFNETKRKKYERQAV